MGIILDRMDMNSNKRHRLQILARLGIKIIISFIFHITTIFGLSAQTTTFDFFVKTGTSGGVGVSFEENDNYYFSGGNCYDTLNRLYETLLMKSDNFGDTTMRYFRAADTSLSIGIIKKTGENFIVFGYYEIMNNDSAGGMYNIVFDTKLEVLSKKRFIYPPGYEGIQSISDDILTDNEGHFISIISLTEPYNSNGFDPGDVCFYKYDGIGDTICTKLFKLDMAQHIDASCFNSDSTEIWVFGSGFQMGVEQWAKFDLDFNLISFEEYYLNAGYPFSIYQQDSHRWIGCAHYNDWDETQEDHTWVFSMNPIGDILNEIVLGTADTIDYPAFRRAIGINETGDIYISGTHNQTIGFFPNVPSWVMLTKLDSNFNHVFTRYYNTDGKYYDNYDLNMCSDGGIILCNGRYDSDNNVDPPLNFDAWVLKVDGDGLLTGQPEEPTVNVKNALVFPNPGCDVLQVSCGWPTAVFNLYDLSGKIVLTEKLNSFTTQINTALLATGGYFWIITKNNNLIETGKWIKE